MESLEAQTGSFGRGGHSRVGSYHVGINFSRVLIFSVTEMTVFRGYIFSRIRHQNAAKIPKIA